ncbi:MAG: helix-turn-helix domain-containing protein [Syntrophobacteraceae bacterium]
MSQSVEYVSDVEVARITGRGVQTLRNERAKGIGIPYVKVGRSVRYKVEDILSFMESRKIFTHGERRMPT